MIVVVERSQQNTMSTDAEHSDGRKEVCCEVTWVEAPTRVTACARYCSNGYKVRTGDEVEVQVHRDAVVSAYRLEGAIAEREDLPEGKVHVVEWEET